MSDPYIGEVRIFAFNYPPQGWAFCNGTVLPVSQNQGLYAVVGNIYGGTAISTLGVPNLQGNAVMGTGAGPGLTPRPSLNTYFGSQTGTVNNGNLPAHDHVVSGVGGANPVNIPSSSVYLSRNLSTNNSATYALPTAGTPVPMASRTVGSVWGNATGIANPHDNEQPFLTMNFCIALQGIYPLKN